MDASRSLYRLLSCGENAFLYSFRTDRLYPISLHLKESLQQLRDGDDQLFRIEEGCCAGQCVAIPARPEGTALREKLRCAVDREVHQVVLGVTENCNLRCQYCVYSGRYTGLRTHSSRRMTWPVARAAIDHLLEHRGESPVPPGIAFYGGEPLLEMPLIRRCVEYAQSRSDGESRFVVTTNGVLLDEATRAFLVEHRFTVTVSLDGPRQIHDRYRRDAKGYPTFERVVNGLQRLREESPEYFANFVRFSVVLAPPIDHGALVDFFDGLGVPCVVSPMEHYGIPNEWRRRFNRQDFDTLAATFTRACRDASTTPGIDLWRRFSVGLLGPALRRIQTRAERPDDSYYLLGQCIPGSRKFFVNTRGDIYPCEKVEGGADVCIGHVSTGVDSAAVERLLTRFVDVVAGNCGSCWMRRMCSACLGDVANGGTFDLGKLRTRCDSRVQSQADVLGFYAALVHDNPSALDFLPEAFPWG